MTEAEWLASGDPVPMLQYLRGVEREAGRKLRLFAVGCCRRLLGEGKVRPSNERLVDVAERYADGAATVSELEAAPRIWSKQPVDHALINASETEPGIGMADGAAGNAAWAATQPGTVMQDDHGVSAARLEVEEAVQSEILRDIFGNPFGRVRSNPAWLTPTVTSLAVAAYQERIMPSGELDASRLAVLADALEEAACTSEAILAHLRSPGPHVRGCWALDLILGKS